MLTLRPLATALALLLAAALWLGATRLATAADARRGTWPKTAQTAFVPPREVVRFFPYRELLADVLWCRTLVYLGGGWGESQLAQLDDFLDDVIAADPRFKPVYEWAAYAVTYKGGTATQAEFADSIRYLEMAMKQYPDDYLYPWIAGARYYFDMWSEDKAVTRRYRERGARLIEAAMEKSNAPPDLASTAAAMRGALGQHQRALDNLKRMILITDDKDARAKMLHQLRVEDPGLADAVEAEAEALRAAWQDSPTHAVPLDFWVQLGPDPPRVIDFRRLATPHDLFGAGAAPPDPVVTP